MEAHLYEPPYLHIAALRHHGVYQASAASVAQAEKHTDIELGRIVAQAYEGIHCGCHNEYRSCYGAEYWRYYYPRTTLVIMVAEFNPVEA